MWAVEVRDVVRFFDTDGVEHKALVTAVHGTPTDEFKPCVNLVYVASEEDKKDPYGRQLLRASSVAHARQTRLRGYSYLLMSED